MGVNYSLVAGMECCCRQEERNEDGVPTKQPKRKKAADAFPQAVTPRNTSPEPSPRTPRATAKDYNAYSPRIKDVIKRLQARKAAAETPEPCKSWVLGDKSASLTVTVQNLNHSRLQADTALLAAVERSVKESVANIAGHGTTPKHVALRLTPGATSVFMHIRVVPPNSQQLSEVRSALILSTSLMNVLTTCMNWLPGVARASTGPITCSMGAVSFGSEPEKPSRTADLSKLTREDDKANPEFRLDDYEVMRERLLIMAADACAIDPSTQSLKDRFPQDVHLTGFVERSRHQSLDERQQTGYVDGDETIEGAAVLMPVEEKSDEKDFAKSGSSEWLLKASDQSLTEVPHTCHSLTPASERSPMRTPVTSDRSSLAEVIRAAPDVTTAAELYAAATDKLQDELSSALHESKRSPAGALSPSLPSTEAEPQQEPHAAATGNFKAELACCLNDLEQNLATEQSSIQVPWAAIDHSGSRQPSTAGELEEHCVIATPTFSSPPPTKRVSEWLLPQKATALPAPGTLADSVELNLHHKDLNIVRDGQQLQQGMMAEMMAARAHSQSISPVGRRPKSERTTGSPGIEKLRMLEEMEATCADDEWNTDQDEADMEERSMRRAGGLHASVPAVVPQSVAGGPQQRCILGSPARERSLPASCKQQTVPGTRDLRNASASPMRYMQRASSNKILTPLLSPTSCGRSANSLPAPAGPGSTAHHRNRKAGGTLR